MKEIAGLGDFGKTVHVLDLGHDIVQDDERRDPPNTPSVCAWLAKVSCEEDGIPTKGEKIDRFIVVFS